MLTTHSDNPAELRARAQVLLDKADALEMEAPDMPRMPRSSAPEEDEFVSEVSRVPNVFGLKHSICLRAGGPAGAYWLGDSVDMDRLCRWLNHKLHEGDNTDELQQDTSPGGDV